MYLQTEKCGRAWCCKGCDFDVVCVCVCVLWSLCVIRARGVCVCVFSRRLAFACYCCLHWPDETCPTLRRVFALVGVWVCVVCVFCIPCSMCYVLYIVVCALNMLGVVCASVFCDACLHLLCVSGMPVCGGWGAGGRRSSDGHILRHRPPKSFSSLPTLRCPLTLHSSASARGQSQWDTRTRAHDDHWGSPLSGQDRLEQAHYARTCAGRLVLPRYGAGPHQNPGVHQRGHSVAADVRGRAHGGQPVLRQVFAAEPSIPQVGPPLH